ncbi:hypothetical protein [Spirosoma sp.]|uniref:hypothetical protein n=1 Tax=Spirosoma sp. TaxID=1899569 RepID=UPI003B3AF1BE
MKNAADTQFLINETQSLLNRLQTVQSFSLNTPMVLAAAVSAPAQGAINDHLARIAFDLRHRLRSFLQWVKNPDIPSHKGQAQYALLKLRYNNLLDQLDIFSDVLLQRGEHGTGTWMAGLDILAEDALTLPGNYYEAPPLICFLERGHGAAIRRARTRLPGGDENPVGVIQIPRERMIGSGIASSLIHEVGHQGSELLGLTQSIKEEINKVIAKGEDVMAWQLYQRWLNEILSDFWAMAHLGVGATYGLMSVVSLPSYFVFRVATDAPHPFPWIRVQVSIALGKTLYPHPQWDALAKQWESLYPTHGEPITKQQIIQSLKKVLPQFANLLINHRPTSLQGKILGEIFPVTERQPVRLKQLYKQWQQQPGLMEKSAPSLVFAVIGQAKADGAITAENESRLLSRILSRWALERAKRYGAGAKPARQPALNGRMIRTLNNN